MSFELIEQPEKDSQIVVGFVRDDSLAGAAIGGNGRGFWGHMTNYISDDWVIDARDNSMRWRGGRIAAGVQVRPAKYLDVNPYFVKLAIPCTAAQREGWLKDLHDQIPLPYDSLGIWGFVDDSAYDRNWQDKSAWFCDELGYWVQYHNEIIPSAGIPPFGLTPGMVYVADMIAGAQPLEYRGIPVYRMLKEAGAAIPLAACS